MSRVNSSYYRADVVFYSDYYPFGAPTTERIALVTPTDVRYGFNEKEVTSEINTKACDVGARLWRWRCVDTLIKDYTNLYPLSYSV